VHAYPPPAEVIVENEDGFPEVPCEKPGAAPPPVPPPPTIIEYAPVPNFTLDPPGKDVLNPPAPPAFP
jgi:hypothetical protein